MLKFEEASSKYFQVGSIIKVAESQGVGDFMRLRIEKASGSMIFIMLERSFCWVLKLLHVSFIFLLGFRV